MRADSERIQSGVNSKIASDFARTRGRAVGVNLLKNLAVSAVSDSSEQSTESTNDELDKKRNNNRDQEFKNR